MSPLHTAALTSVALAAAVTSLVLGVRPRRRTLAEVRAILYPAAGARPGATTPSPSRRRAVTGPLAARVEHSIGDGLRLIGLDAATVVSRVLAGFAVGSFTVVLSVGALISAGMAPLSPLWVPLSLATGAGAAWVMWSDVGSRIETRRRALRRTTNDFIQLVAVGLTTDQSVEEAVQFALGVGDSDLFDLLRTELATAPVRGVPLWEALEQLGSDLHQRELEELGASIERQGTQGVSITDTVTTLATAMRAKALDELERDADRANANLSGPTIAFVVTTVVFLVYPLAIRIGEAFGG